jgi:hypothetical protein
VSQDEALRNGRTSSPALVYGGRAIGVQLLPPHYRVVTHTKLQICNGNYQYQVVTMIRGGLVSLICFYTLALDEHATKSSATLTLMSTDVERVCASCAKLHELWVNFIEVAIAIWLLER